MLTWQSLITGLLVAGLLAGPPARSADAPPAVITRDQAAQLLDTLKDPEKRERFTATLEAYLQALPPGGAAAPAATSATLPAAPARIA